jgi:uncharacterized surface anchored protein
VNLTRHFLCVWLVAVFLCPVSAAPNPQTLGELKCTVTDRKYRVPVADAFITIYAEDRVRQGKTDKKGVFNFTGLPFQNYELKIWAPSYTPVFLPDTQISSQKPTELSIALDFWNASSEQSALCRPETITPTSLPSERVSYEERTSRTNVTGVIYDEWNHKLVSGATVSLLDTGRLNKALATSRSDDFGAFQFDDVKPGKYALSVTREGYYPVPPFLPFWVTHANLARIARIGLDQSGLQDTCGMVSGDAPLIEPKNNPIPELIPPQ